MWYCLKRNGACMEKNTVRWSSHLSFIIAVAGSAAGLGNIWRFPYITGKYGGGVFLLTYLILILFLCSVPLICELAIGKTYRSDTISSFVSVNPKLKIFAFMCILTVIFIPCFYFVVGGWIINYVFLFLTNHIPSDFSGYFVSFSSKPVIPCLFTLLFLAITAYFPFKGVNNGVEKANNIMMPLFLVMLIILAGFSLTLPGAKAGLKFMFMPDFSQFGKTMILTALAQALFTLSIGIGTILTYGSYMKEETNIFKSAYTLIFCDTLIAVLSGIMIFPAVFSFGMQPEAGPALAFIALPEIISKLPFSCISGTLFFLLLFFAAVTSGISMFETSIAALIGYFKLSRKKATLIITLVTGILCIPSTLSFGSLSGFKPFGKTFFDLLDYSTSTLLMPFNTLVICLIGGWGMKTLKNKVFPDNKTAGMFFDIMLKFVLPVVLVGVFIFGL